MDEFSWSFQKAVCLSTGNILFVLELISIQVQYSLLFFAF